MSYSPSSLVGLTTLLVSLTPPTALTAGCPIHPEAHQGPPHCHGAYGKLRDDNSVDEWHDGSYWAIRRQGEAPYIHDLGPWLADCAAQMPIYLPKRDPQVSVITPYVTGAGRIHGGIDYARPDGESFSVHSIADGRVIFSGYHPIPGNVVIIEHTPPSGATFRSIYQHLRNGREYDVAVACRTKAFCEEAARYPFNDVATKWQALGEEAAVAIANGTREQWLEQTFGRDEEIVLVTEGDLVHAGQQIGWAGRTGIQAKGTQLHLMVARVADFVADEPAPIKRWTLFDPYGLYGAERDLEAYRIDDGVRGPGQHPSIFAPVTLDFAGVDQTTFDQACRYYASFGYYPCCLAATPGRDVIANARGAESCWVDDDWTLSGSFRPSPEKVVVRALRTEQEQRTDTMEWKARDWCPSYVSAATLGGSAEPRFVTIYSPESRPFQVQHKLSADALERTQQQMVEDGYVLQNLAPYVASGELWFSATWIQPQDFEEHILRLNLTAEEVDETASQQRAQGHYLAELVSYVVPGVEERFAAIFRRLPEEADTRYVTNIPDQDLASVSDRMKQAGYNLRHLTAQPPRFHAVFEKQAAEPQVCQAPPSPGNLTIVDEVACCYDVHKEQAIITSFEEERPQTGCAVATGANEASTVGSEAVQGPLSQALRILVEGIDIDTATSSFSSGKAAAGLSNRFGGAATKPPPLLSKYSASIYPFAEERLQVVTEEELRIDQEALAAIDRSLDDNFEKTPEQRVASTGVQRAISPNSGGAAFEATVGSIPEERACLRQQIETSLAALVPSLSIPWYREKAGVVQIEGEDLRASVLVNAGTTYVEDMSRISWEWGDGKQLLWEAPDIDAEMLVSLPISRSGQYVLEAVLGSDSNYGMIQVYQHDKPIGGKINLYSPTLQRKTVTLGTVQLEEGLNNLLIRVEGRDDASNDCWVGIDYIRATPE